MSPTIPKQTTNLQRRRAVFWKRTLALVFCVFAPILLVFGRSAAHAANAFPSIKRSLVLIEALTPDGQFIAAGTGFCVSSDGRKSYFLTNRHVVTDDQGAPYARLVVIFLSRPSAKNSASVIRRSLDPDLAILSINVPNIPHVHLSTELPTPGDDVAIAGYPFNELRWAGVSRNRGIVLDRPFPKELVASMHKGNVSAIHGGSYYIQYDALTDFGNSGGPLFDPANGNVLGVVQGSTEGAREQQDIPSSIHNNLAISVLEGWPFIARAPVRPDATVAEKIAKHAATHGLTGPRECIVGQDQLGKAYGQWSQAHGGIASIEQYINDPRYVSKKATLAKRAVAYGRSEQRAQSDMGRAVAMIARANTSGSLSFAKALLGAVSAAAPRDSQLANALTTYANAGGHGHFTRPSSIPAAEKLDQPIAEAARKVSSLLDCSQ